MGHLVCWAQHRACCVPEHSMRLTDSQGLRVCSSVTCRLVRRQDKTPPASVLLQGSSSSCVCALVRENPPAGPHTQKWCVDADSGVKMDVTWE